MPIGESHNRMPYDCTSKCVRGGALPLVGRARHCHQVSKRPFGQYCNNLLNLSDTCSISGANMLLRTGCVACAAQAQRPEHAILIAGLSSYLQSRDF
jgi:hypothetical protein